VNYDAWEVLRSCCWDLPRRWGVGCDAYPSPAGGLDWLCIGRSRLLEYRARDVLRGRPSDRDAGERGCWSRCHWLHFPPVIALRRVSAHDGAADRCVRRWTVYKVVRRTLPCTQTHRAKQSAIVLSASLTSLLRNHTMTRNAKIALNPLPWVLTERGFPALSSRPAPGFSEIVNHSISRPFRPTRPKS
jgi:hypothetical protein